VSVTGFFGSKFLKEQTMRIPSVKTLSVFGGEEIAKTIRGEMQKWVEKYGHRNVRPERLFERLSGVIGGFGVEYIPAGEGSRSPSVLYINKGDTYRTTIMWVRGRFVVGCWGDIVERGQYA
jgi:hypothetical protein